MASEPTQSIHAGLGGRTRAAVKIDIGYALIDIQWIEGHAIEIQGVHLNRIGPRYALFDIALTIPTFVDDLA